MSTVRAYSCALRSALQRTPNAAVIGYLRVLWFSVAFARDHTPHTETHTYAAYVKEHAQHKRTHTHLNACHGIRIGSVTTAADETWISQRKNVYDVRRERSGTGTVWI